MKHWSLFALVMLAHLALSVASLLWSFRISSEHLDGHAMSALVSSAANGLLAITWFPLNLVSLPASTFPGFMGWFPVIGNSMIWTGFITWVVHWVRRSPRSRSQPGLHTH